MESPAFPDKWIQNDDTKNVLWHLGGKSLDSKYWVKLDSQSTNTGRSQFGWMNARSTNILEFWYCFIAVATSFPEIPQTPPEGSVYSSAWDVELKKMSEQSRLLKRMNLDAPIRVNLSATERKYFLEQIKSKINPSETQSIIGLTNCKQNGCFFFVPPQDLPSETIQSAQLVIKSSIHLNEPRRVDIYEITPSGTYEELAKNVVAPINQKDISVDITSATRQWMSSNGRQRRTLQIYVDGRSMDANAAEVEVIQKNDDNSPPPAITAVCTYNSNCCLQYFYLNFTEIGWDNWILSPEGYSANLCTGKCQYRRLSWWNAEINIKQSVCAPTKFKPLTIIYLAGPNDIRQKTIHGMQAVECGCD